MTPLPFVRRKQYGITRIHSHRFYGIQAGGVFLIVRDVRLWPVFATERNKIGCRHLTLGSWRWVVRWSVPA